MAPSEAGAYFLWRRFADEGCGDSAFHVATCYDLGLILAILTISAITIILAILAILAWRSSHVVIFRV